MKWWQETILHANWKMAQEAFMEGWHVMRTHPQLTLGAGEMTPPDSLRYDVYTNGHCSFESTVLERDFFNFDVMLASSQLLADGLDAMAIDRDMKVLESIRHKLKPGDSIREAVAREMRAYNEGAGIPMPAGIENRPLWWSGMVFLFPNIFYLPMYGNSLAYRIRPYGDDPERCRFEVWSLTTWPDSYPLNRAALRGRFDKDDEQNWPLIPVQDFSNIERQQKGLHVLGYQGHRLATVWEAGSANMHRELDRRLAQDPVQHPAWRQGYHWPTTCWGDMQCMVCAAVIRDGEHAVTPASAAEDAAVSARMPRFRQQPGTRLACQLLVTGDGLVIEKDGVRPPAEPG